MDGIDEWVNKFAGLLFIPGMTRAEQTLLAVEFSLNPGGNETIISRPLLKLAASAILEHLKSDDVLEAARYLPSALGSTTTLATLFDDTIVFDLSEGEIRFDSKMRYTYATVDYRITETGELVFRRDSTDKENPYKARVLTGMTEAANHNVDHLMQAFPPLANVRKYAEVAAFLRWAVCPGIQGNQCRSRDGLSIDFSVLGKYPLRDKKRTPTPDADKRKS